MKLTIEINATTKAFEKMPEAEVGRLLMDIGVKLNQGDTFEPQRFNLLDIDGELVGSVTVVE
ncbi:hypothetical protein N9937_00695 [bacterium]|nr:hypothetical protein [bacterium]